MAINEIKHLMYYILGKNYILYILTKLMHYILMFENLTNMQKQIRCR